MAFVYTWWAVFSPEERRKEEAAWHHDNVKISSSLSFKRYELRYSCNHLPLGGKQQVATSVFPSDFIFLSLGKEGWKDLVFMPNKLMFCYTGLEEAVVSLQQPENSTANDPQTKRFRIAPLADRLRSFPTLQGLRNKLFSTWRCSPSNGAVCNVDCLQSFPCKVPVTNSHWYSLRTRPFLYDDARSLRLYHRRSGHYVSLLEGLAASEMLCQTPYDFPLFVFCQPLSEVTKKWQCLLLLMVGSEGQRDNAIVISPLEWSCC